jgi:hypothetical protein
MKNQFFGILFYLLYLLAMVRPILPVLEYHVNYDYIVSALCENRNKPYLACNGKCYLEKQIKKINHTNHEHKSTVPQINFDDYPVSPLGHFSYQTKEVEEIVLQNYFETCATSQSFKTSLLKPPQV